MDGALNIKCRILAASIFFAVILSGPKFFTSGKTSASELPPEQGSKLHFKKTLFVQSTGMGKVFAETKRLEPGDTLWQIFTEQYNIPNNSLQEFLSAFEKINPSIDSDKLLAGQVVRIPFKIEASLPSPPAKPLNDAAYTVVPGDSLWKILSKKYQVPKENMQGALDAIALANPKISDLNRLWVGQKINIPNELLHEREPTVPTEKAKIPTSLISLLQKLNCVVSREGETFLPLERGRTVKFNAGDFPLITSPSGKKAILDPEGRVPPALARSIDEAWGYKIIGAAEDAEGYLEEILPHMSFYDLSEGEKLISFGGGSELKAMPRWTITPAAKDLWEGTVHLIFGEGATLDPNLVETARNAGFSIHLLGSMETQQTRKKAQDSPPAPEISMKDPAIGSAALLSLLGISHQLRPEVTCNLAGGITYKVKPELTFQYQGMSFAIPPESPKNAEAILYRAGFFTVGWRRNAAALNKLGDLLALLGVPHARASVEAPKGHSIRIVTHGIILEQSSLARLLYPTRTDGIESPKILLTEAPLPPTAVSALIGDGVLPWVMTTK